MKIALTGANSSVGLNLLGHMLAHNDLEAIAGVRSDSAAKELPSSVRITPRIIRYDDVAGLAAAMQGATCVVHLAGILIESKQSSYQTANIDATAAVVKAAQQAAVKHIVFVSVIGADANSSNAYYRSKGVAEKLVEQSGIAATVIRTPMLLGPGTAGAMSLVGTASRDKAGILGGGYYHMQPLDVDDLSDAILNSCQSGRAGAQCYDLAGPESVAFRDLVSRTATLMGRSVTIKSVPVWIARLGAAVTSRIKGGGMTPTVIDVITQDEKITHNSDRALGITLTPLNSTLNKIIKK